MVNMARVTLLLLLCPLYKYILGNIVASVIRIILKKSFDFREKEQIK